jgi:hypothetical protein
VGGLRLAVETGKNSKPEKAQKTRCVPTFPLHVEDPAQRGCVGQLFDLQSPCLLKEYKPSRQNLSRLAISSSSLIQTAHCVVNNVSWHTFVQTIHNFCRFHSQLLHDELLNLVESKGI